MLSGLLASSKDGLLNTLIVILLGILVRWIIKNSGFAIKYIFSFFRSEAILVGDRTMYHLTEDINGERFLCIQQVKIRRSPFKEYSISVSEGKNGKKRQVYKGSMKIEGADYVIQLTSTFHLLSVFDVESKGKETISIRVKRIYHDEDQDMPGFYLGISHKSRNYVTTCLITKDSALDERSYKLRMKNYTCLLTCDYYWHEK